MKKIIGRIIVCLCMTLLFISFIKMDSQAASTVTDTLKFGSWTKMAPETAKKVVIKKNMMIEVSTKNGEGLSLYLQNKLSGKNIKDIFWFYLEKSNNTRYYYVKKGTYYLVNYSSTNSCEVSFKEIGKKLLDNNNYCIANATKLAKNKTVYNYSAPMYSQNAWYKITLTKSQVLNYWTNNSSCVAIFDDKEGSNSIDVVEDKNGKYHSYEVLPAGTYYVCLYGRVYANATSFKWK